MAIVIKVIRVVKQARVLALCVKVRPCFRDWLFVVFVVEKWKFITITATESAFLTIYVPGGKNSGRDVARELQVVGLIGLLANYLCRQ